MTYIAGDVPIVFVAPHGGRRPAEAPILDSIKVNDLYTAELTTELVRITGGYALINHAHDRNACRKSIHPHRRQAGRLLERPECLWCGRRWAR